MKQSGEVKVSERGQMALPAQTRHRWGLDQGGVVGWIDMGDSVLLGSWRVEAAARRNPPNADWDSARSGFGDPELANQ